VLLCLLQGDVTKTIRRYYLAYLITLAVVVFEQGCNVNSQRRKHNGITTATAAATA
jgi:hypothetical protein